jgi:hypothetical protein
MYDDWKGFARALISSLENLANQSASDGDITYVVNQTPITAGQLPAIPAGWSPVWLNTVDAGLYLANPDYSPPTAPNIVYIDTGNLADAAIEVAKLADGAVTSAKILNATIGSADIGNAQIISALIADAAIVSAKIGDLQVNNAKIANASIDSAKIANLAVGTAHIQAAAIGTAQIANAAIVSALIQDGAIVNAKIGNVIQSATWNSSTKAGWMIDKNGLIQGQGVAIYDTSGNLVFGSGGSLTWSRITGFDPSEFGNRVTFSRFELAAPVISAYGWYPDNPVGLAGWGSTITTQEGYKGLYANANFTANAQYFDIRKPRSVPVTPGERLAIGVRAAWTTGWTFQVIIGYFNAAGSNISYTYPINISGVSTNWGSRFTAFDTVPAGAVEAELFFRLANQTGVTGTGSLRIAEPFVGGATANQSTVQPFSPGPNGFFEQMVSGNISSFMANAAIQQAQIANLAVGTAQIQDLAVTSAKIVSLDAAKINAASLSAITATIGLLRTATSGARLEVESNQIRVYDASNVLRVRMGIW